MWCQRPPSSPPAAFVGARHSRYHIHNIYIFTHGRSCYVRVESPAPAHTGRLAARTRASAGTRARKDAFHTALITARSFRQLAPRPGHRVNRLFVEVLQTLHHRPPLSLTNGSAIDLCDRNLARLDGDTRQLESALHAHAHTRTRARTRERRLAPTHHRAGDECLIC